MVWAVVMSAFAVDTALCFGYGPSAGTYGSLHDASLDIL